MSSGGRLYSFRTLILIRGGQFPSDCRLPTRRPHREAPAAFNYPVAWANCYIMPRSIEENMSDWVGPPLELVMQTILVYVTRSWDNSPDPFLGR